MMIVESRGDGEMERWREEERKRGRKTRGKRKW